MSKVNRVGRAFSTLPFDGIDNVANITLHDDFVTAENIADLVDANGVEFLSELQWLAEETVGAGVAQINVLDGEKNHPGIIQLQTGATSPADGDMAALQLGGGEDDDQNTLVLDDNGVYLATIVRLPDKSDQQVEFGLAGQALVEPNNSATDIVSFVWDPDDSANGTDQFFIAQVNSASTDVEEAFTLPYDADDDWVLLEIYATDEDAYFRMTTDDASETVHLTPAAMPLVGLRPFISVAAVGAAEESLEIDAFHLRYQRQGYNANNDTAWLGQ